MPRLSRSGYDLRVMAAMTLYVVLLLALLPLARRSGNQPMQVSCSLLPVLPLLYVVWLMGRRIWHSDELEQRTHLIGLGAASAVIGTLSLISGFLAVSNNLSADSTALVLLWMFPLMMLSYGASRWYAARRYGMQGVCDDEEGIPLYRRFLIATGLLGAIAIWASLGHTGAFQLGMIYGMTGVFGAAGVIAGLRRWRAQRHAPPAE